MNCPYCDETVHAMAKFCPKCGLPLKDDATIMGGPVVDQPGPNRWFIVAGVGGVVALALSLGFMSARGSSRPTQTTRREPVGRYFAPSSTTMGGAYAQPRSLTPIPRGAAPMAPSPRPSLGYGGGTRWAYTPRAPQPRSFVPQAPQAPPPDPAPPQVPLAQIDALRPRGGYVSAASPSTPPLPDAPILTPPPVYYPRAAYGAIPPSPGPNPYGPAYYPASPEADAARANVYAPPASPLRTAGQEYDPVQDRYVPRSDIGAQASPDQGSPYTDFQGNTGTSR